MPLWTENYYVSEPFKGTKVLEGPLEGYQPVLVEVSR